MGPLQELFSRSLIGDGALVGDEVFVRSDSGGWRGAAPHPATYQRRRVAGWGSIGPHPQRLHFRLLYCPGIGFAFVVSLGFSQINKMKQA